MHGIHLDFPTTNEIERKNLWNTTELRPTTTDQGGDGNQNKLCNVRTSGENFAEIARFHESRNRSWLLCSLRNDVKVLVIALVFP